MKMTGKKKSGHCGLHLLLFTSLSFVATLVSSQNQPDAEALVWHSNGVRGHNEITLEGSQPTWRTRRADPQIPGALMFF